MSTITTQDLSGVKPGNRLVVITPDPNKWRRFWHWLLRLDPPTLRRVHEVTAVKSGSVAHIRLNEKS